MRRPGIWAVAVLLVALAAGGFYAWLPSSGSAPAATAAATTVPPVTVAAAPVKIDRLVVELEAVGSLQSNESVVIRPEISGRIVALPLKEGDRVDEKQVLVELDATILRAELAQAEANLRLAEANFERSQTLYGQGSGTARARDEAVARLASDRAALALAKARLEKATIVAPFEGILGLRSVSVGAYVTPADSLVNLEDLDPLKVDFRLPEIYWEKLKPGQRISITVDALPGRTVEGEVYAIDPLVDVNGRAIRLRARVPNPDLALTAGLFARVRLVADARDNVVFVPESAIVARDRETYVFRVEDGRAVLTKVTLGDRRPGEVEIAEGLAPGQTVVTTGQLKLRDGAAVEPVIEKAAETRRR